MATNTTNYNFIKPAVNDPADQDLWGGYLNENWDSIDGLLKSASDVVTSTKTGAYTVTSSDRNALIQGDATSAPFNISLPTASSVENGFTVGIKKIDVSANSVTVDGNGTETIDGSETYVLSNQYDVVLIVSDGTNWKILANTQTTTFADNTSSNTGTAVDEALTPANFGTQNDLSASGYQKLPGGAIMQWGQVTNVVGNTPVVFPVAFPTQVGTIINQALGSDSSNEYYVGDVYNLTLTGFNSAVHVNGDSNPVGQKSAITSKWFAIGY